MMYNKRLVCSIRSNGKILREFKDTVYLPFGAEYSLLIKNLNTVKALVNVYIDGTNIVPGGLILHAGQEIDLERSITNGNMNVGNKLKFIERTGNIENHRGIKLEDGIVRVEYQFEKVYAHHGGYIETTIPHQPYYGGELYGVKLGDSALRSSGASAVKGIAPTWTSSTLMGSASTSNINAAASNAALTSYNVPQNETGITVAGSKSEQKFVTASRFVCEPEKHSIVIRLLGETEDNKLVREPITVKHKQKCSMCNHTNKATAKFCSECGTSLVLFA